jgi:uncharacterized protein (DUF2237 family)
MSLEPRGVGRGPSPSRNVFGEKLESCSTKPLTGFFRNGCCDTGPQDVGSHTVCVVVTDEFLEFSRSRGNDLSTPMPDFGFPGLKAGDRWCLCAPRWQDSRITICSGLKFFFGMTKLLSKPIPIQSLGTKRASQVTRGRR